MGRDYADTSMTSYYCPNTGDLIDEETGNVLHTANYANLSTDAASLDQALYVASCMCGAWAGGIAHIYASTHPAQADTATGERYIIAADDDGTRHHLDRSFHLVYTITHGPRDV